MELRDYIEIGSKKAGSLTSLGTFLGKGQTNMSQIKAGKMPLPIEDCVKLADYIDADRFDVIAAAKFASAKNDEKRNYWMQFIGQAKTAAYMIIALSVTNLLTPSHAEAAPAIKHRTHILYYVKKLLKQLKLTRFLRSTLDHLRQLVCDVISVAHPTLFQLRIGQTQA